MKKNGIISKNFFLDSETVCELGSCIQVRMSAADREIKLAKGYIKKIARLATSVPPDTKCCELLTACAVAEDALASTEYLTFGKDVNRTLLMLAEEANYADEETARNVGVLKEQMYHIQVIAGEFIKMLSKSVVNVNLNLKKELIDNIVFDGKSDKTEWIPPVMQYDGNSAQEKQLKIYMDNINTYIEKNYNKKEKESLRWNQDKINSVWKTCENYYTETGVQIDPRLLLAIIFQEGTGSFNTNSEQLAVDGGNGKNLNFENDLELALDLLGGKIMVYPIYQETFSAEREAAYVERKSGIADYDDILHYLNWKTPRVSFISDTFFSGVYADDSAWNRKVRQIYSELAYDQVSRDYTSYVLSLDKDLINDQIEKHGIEMKEVYFEAVMEGADCNKKPNGDYVIVGRLNPEP